MAQQSVKETVFSARNVAANETAAVNILRRNKKQSPVIRAYFEGLIASDKAADPQWAAVVSLAKAYLPQPASTEVPPQGYSTRAAPPQGFGTKPAAQTVEGDDLEGLLDGTVKLDEPEHVVRREFTADGVQCRIVTAGETVRLEHKALSGWKLVMSSAQMPMFQGKVTLGKVLAVAREKKLTKMFPFRGDTYKVVGAKLMKRTEKGRLILAVSKAWANYCEHAIARFMAQPEARAAVACK